MNIANFLIAVLAEKKWFWKVRRRVYRILFSKKNYVLSLRNKGIEEYEASKYFRAIVPNTLPQLFLALGTALILQYINKYFIHLYSLFGWAELDKGVYATFFATIASIGAVFIGLYYTALTTIAASTFAKTPSGVRGLLSREKVGNVYIRFLAYLTSLSIFLLTLRLLNYQEVLISIPIVSFFSCFGVVAFVKLGQRVFSFFDPIQLSGHINRQFQDALSIADSHNSNAFDPSFQKFTQFRAKQALNSISDLISICRTESHLQKNSLASLGTLIFNLLSRYEFIKQRIPSKSLWFPQDTKFELIYRQSDSSVQMAHQTGHFNSFDTEANHWWVEDAVLEQLFIVLIFNLDNENTNAVESFFGSLGEILGIISKTGEVEKAVLFYSKVVDICAPYFKTISNKRLKLIICEALARIPIFILLEFRSYAIEISQIEWDEVLSNLNWRDRRSIYKLNFPQHLLSELEDLNSRLNFEFDVENKLITPVWYLKEILFRRLSEKLANEFRIIYSPIDGKIGHLLAQLREDIDPIQQSLIIGVFKEFLNKLAVHQHSFEEAFDKLTSCKQIVGLKWSSLNSDDAKKSVRNLSLLIAKKTAELSEVLSSVQFDSTLPDFAGRFLHETGESIFETLITNDSKLFNELYEKYFNSCILMFEKLKPDSSVPQFRLSNEVRVSLGPIADLIDLSGYALFFSELYECDSYQKTVKEIWDKFLDRNTVFHGPLRNIIEVTIQMSFDVMSEPHRSLLRMQWASETNQMLRSRFNLDDDYFDYPSQKNTIDHKSALVRVFAQSHSRYEYKGVHVFDALYFSKEGLETIDIDKDVFSNHLKRKLSEESEDENTI